MQFRKTVQMLGVGVVAFSCTMVALATDITKSPGWQYGGLNCGCYSNPNPTTASCNACCNGAEIPMGPLTPGQVTNCLAFCAQAVFPCQD